MTGQLEPEITLKLLVGINALLQINVCSHFLDSTHFFQEKRISRHFFHELFSSVFVRLHYRGRASHTELETGTLMKGKKRKRNQVVESIERERVIHYLDIDLREAAEITPDLVRNRGLFHLLLFFFFFFFFGCCFLTGVNHRHHEFRTQSASNERQTRSIISKEKKKKRMITNKQSTNPNN
jgi:hypothetical protein